MSNQQPVVTTLTKRQQLFRDYYLASFNATDAARRAGYKHPNQQGPELLKKPQIAAAIDERLNEVAMSANEVLARLTEHARFDIGVFLDGDGNLDLKQIKDSGLTRMVKKLNTSRASGTSPKGGDWERETIVVEPHDAQTALVQLGRYHKLFTDKSEVAGEGGGVIRVRVTNDD